MERSERLCGSSISDLVALSFETTDQSLKQSSGFLGQFEEIRIGGAATSVLRLVEGCFELTQGTSRNTKVAESCFRRSNPITLGDVQRDRRGRSACLIAQDVPLISGKGSGVSTHAHDQLAGRLVDEQVAE
jgi:hypothetical protein